MTIFENENELSEVLNTLGLTKEEIIHPCEKCNMFQTCNNVLLYRMSSPKRLPNFCNKSSKISKEIEMYYKNINKKLRG